MAREELFKRFPLGEEEVEVPGIFRIRNNGAPYNLELTYSVIVQQSVLVTMGGPDARLRATRLACAFNAVWNDMVGVPEGTASSQQGVISSPDIDRAIPKMSEVQRRF